MHKYAVFAVVRCPSSVRLSVCPSVTLVYCIETSEHVLKLFLFLAASLFNHTGLSSLKGKEKDVSKKNYYVCSTMKIEDTEVLE